MARPSPPVLVAAGAVEAPAGARGGRRDGDQRTQDEGEARAVASSWAHPIAPVRRPQGGVRDLDRAAGSDRAERRPSARRCRRRGSRPRPRPSPASREITSAGPSEASTSSICSFVASSRASKRRCPPPARARRAAWQSAVPRPRPCQSSITATRPRRCRRPPRGRTARRRGGPGVSVDGDQRLVVGWSTSVR